MENKIDVVKGKYFRFTFLTSIQYTVMVVLMITIDSKRELLIDIFYAPNFN